MTFQKITELTYVLMKDGHAATLDNLQEWFGVTPSQLDRFLAEAVDAGVMERRDGEIMLTPAGQSLGAAMQERVKNAQTRAIEAFVPYTAYVPERWSP